MEGYIVSIRTKLEKEDYKKILINSLLTNKIRLIILLLLDILMPFLVIEINYLYLTFKSFLLIFLCTLVLESIGISIGILISYKKILRTDKSGIINSKNTIGFYDDYIWIKDSSGDNKSKLLYSNFYKVKENKNFLLMYVNYRQASVIRKKDMSNEEIDKLRNILNEKLGSKFKSRYKK